MVIQKINLENKACSASNANTDFVGLNRLVRVNVHTKVKDALQGGVIGLGCPAQISRNTARTALDVVNLDDKCLLTKKCRDFYNFTFKVEY